MRSGIKTISYIQPMIPEVCKIPAQSLKTKNEYLHLEKMYLKILTVFKKTGWALEVWTKILHLPFITQGMGKTKKKL